MEIGMLMQYLLLSLLDKTRKNKTRQIKTYKGEDGNKRKENSRLGITQRTTGADTDIIILMCTKI